VEWGELWYQIAIRVLLYDMQLSYDHNVWADGDRNTVAGRFHPPAQSAKELLRNPFLIWVFNFRILHRQGASLPSPVNVYRCTDRWESVSMLRGLKMGFSGDFHDSDPPSVTEVLTWILISLHYLTCTAILHELHLASVVDTFYHHPDILPNILRNNYFIILIQRTAF